MHSGDLLTFVVDACRTAVVAMANRSELLTLPVGCDREQWVVVARNDPQLRSLRSGSRRVTSLPDDSSASSCVPAKYRAISH